MSRIESLLGRMTLAEKLGQLTMTACGDSVTGPVIAGDSTTAIREGAIGSLLNLIGAEHVLRMQRIAVGESRLGIPLLIGLDVLHGHRSLFPIPLAETGLFDPALWEATARESAAEAAADGLAMTFAPMLDVTRDPRWGRIAEGPGEDPVVAARFAVAKVRGLQGASLAAADALAGVAKHFGAYGAVTAGREYAAVDVSERALRELHFPAFEAAVGAGVAALMPAFTDLAGVPMTANRELLRGCLREHWGFDGVVISDYDAIGELIRHGIAADLAEAAALALNAGIDIDMMSNAFRHGLPLALERGLASLDSIDASVRRVLRLKERLGLFDGPYRRGSLAEPAPRIAARRRLAREVAARSTILLKNRDRVLPLPRDLRELALIGPLADAAEEMRGPWPSAGAVRDHVGVLAGLRAALPNARIRHEPGVDLLGEATRGIAAALECCAGSDAVVLCLGEAASMSGEAASRAHLGLPGRQRELFEAVAARATTLGKPLIAVLFSGRPLIVPWLVERADAVLAAWFPGCEAGNALADVLLGLQGPSGRTPVSWPRAIGQIPLAYAERSGGRPADPAQRMTSRYLDEANEPLFRFGHGLSYGEFVHSNLRIAPATLREADSLAVEVDVRNEGPLAAEETVFLFARDLLASVTRPSMELKGFAKARLEAGESATVSLRLPARDLRFPGPDLRPLFEAGEVEILVGPCADRSRLQTARIQLID